ncbi:hypothetical protein DDE82_004146 [Stemphylium lycopersici]|nr:hypothetical protein TW65_03736 [Stemphylium lycopersici]RAR05126.1 hypothetical protein DDE82_004146 [Stemphylium lycopersici]
MFLVRASTTVLILFANMAATSGPTSIFIDQVEQYALLATCAELELSTIVRNMEYGCGDDSQYTSFTCFCYESSAKFSSIIGEHVSTKCPEDPSQNTTALEVFSSYCEIGQSKLAQQAASTTTSSFTSASSDPSASPVPTPPSTSATSTSEPAPSSEPTQAPKETSNTAAIAAGVTVPVVFLASALIIFFLYRRSQKKKKSLSLSELDTSSADPSKSVTCHEVGNDAQVRAEVPGKPISYELSAAEVEERK